MKGGGGGGEGSLDYENLVLFENNQIITASHIMILTDKMTMNGRSNMIGLNEKDKERISELQNSNKFTNLQFQ